MEVRKCPLELNYDTAYIGNERASMQRYRIIPLCYIDASELLMLLLIVQQISLTGSKQLLL